MEWDCNRIQGAFRPGQLLARRPAGWRVGLRASGRSALGFCALSLHEHQPLYGSGYQAHVTFSCGRPPRPIRNLGINGSADCMLASLADLDDWHGILDRAVLPGFG